jgi:alpha-beta hydrolase superfamily lysophospholipase
VTADRDRISFGFSANARFAACLVTTPDGGHVAGHWAFGDGGTRYRRTAAPETLLTQPLPTDDGRLLLLRGGAGRHELLLTDPARPASPADSVTVRARGLRLAHRVRADALATAVETDGNGHTTVRHVLTGPLRLERALELPGRIAGVHRLDPDGHRFATDLLLDGAPVPVVADMAGQDWRRLPQPRGTRSLRVLLSCPRTGTLVVAADTGEGTRLGTLDAAAPGRVRFPAGLDAVGGAVFPLALDPDGRRIALRVTRGASAELYVHDLARGDTARTALPAGAVDPVAGWARDGLRVPWSRPGVPADVVRVPLPGDTAAPAAPPPGRPDAGTERFGGTGFEAVCVGDWRRSDRVVVALHGGPEAAWQLRHDPLLHRFAEAGAAVVAPNQRGSTGYGPAHASAVHGAWGVPDLADVRELVAELTAGRAPDAPLPALYGISYGAFLALLAVAADPQAWARCAVVAPFLSAAGLHAAAGAGTRALIERHRAAAAPAPGDALGARDAGALAGRIRTPLMVVHGTADPKVPVTQSRELRARLLASGRREGPSFVYTEVPGAGHDPLAEPGGTALAARLTRFLTAGGRGSPRPLPELTAALRGRAASPDPVARERSADKEVKTR